MRSILTTIALNSEFTSIPDSRTLIPEDQPHELAARIREFVMRTN